VGGSELHTTVYPFLLRGVTLAGIDSAWLSHLRRVELWGRLAGPWKLNSLHDVSTCIGLGQLTDHVKTILAGQSVGRVIVAPWQA
jgi:hypothetical protein